MLNAIGVMEVFETWAPGSDTRWYQWAQVRRSE
jgi:hypothetical protein